MSERSESASGTDPVGEPRAPLTTTTSIRPAASVLVIAMVMLIVFIAINTVFDQAAAPSQSTVVVVGGLNLDAQSHLFTACDVNGEPPSNIRSAFLVPIDTRALSPVNHHSHSSYDCSRELSSTHPQSQILGFYRDQLVARGWSLFSRGPAPRTGKEEYLFSKAGNDTFFWVVGVIITSHHRASTHWTVYLQQKDSIA
jgi:hypothetical protein